MPENLDQWMTAARDSDDQAAYGRVVEACQHLLRASVLRETADPELADEIAQDALVRGWERREQYQPGTSPRAWLLTITRNQLMAHHRRRGRNHRHMNDLIHHELLRHQRSADLEPSPQDAARLAALKISIAELSDEQRSLLSMIHEQGMTAQMAADEMGISHAACRQRISRLQRSLKGQAEQLLGEEEGESA